MGKIHKLEFKSAKAIDWNSKVPRGLHDKMANKLDDEKEAFNPGRYVLRDDQFKIVHISDNDDGNGPSDEYLKQALNLKNRKYSLSTYVGNNFPDNAFDNC